MPNTKYKAAAVTSEPGWFDLEGSVQKTVNFIDEAGQAGCKLVAFPEVWVPGYPYWMWKVTYLQSLPMLKKYRQNALRVDSEEMRRIRRAARDNQIFVSMGFAELDQATLYLSQVLIDPSGNVINHRRKIKPTHVEKLVYGDGSGDTFMSVTETGIGRVGQLNCWENMNPFLKALNVSQGEQVHIAGWPVYPGKECQVAPDPATNYADPASDLVTPAYAIETGTWVLAPFQRLSIEGLKKNTPEGVEPETDPSVYNGHARIYKPDGSLVAKPDKDFDGLLFVDIDLDEIHLTKALADFAGHYMRPDLIRLLVDTRRKELVTEADPHSSIARYSTYNRLGLDRPLDSKPEMYEHDAAIKSVSKEPTMNSIKKL
ncbi:carbon-nitrogen hydrolase [Colletotrichum graminicola]|uniref:Cyanide hydratase n=1 Tax=Colletotrichum graminicola (strain M1.001 / M2 / FGSC 10212) TaxID=645133 RepID=E3Q566_COLGM|nr:carbon-nitrogen hydrolase [Colletotrichum graminicola M1.001]EFQ25833.1 carbon-nitrogen hydrolase [Colletotrichum graminicola M1.001]WDK22942.1 carbon-nitrogen hydrolase [Colletotrichum graminicola]